MAVDDGQQQQQQREHQSLRPFAVIDEVRPGSPAESAGLQLVSRGRRAAPHRCAAAAPQACPLLLLLGMVVETGPRLRGGPAHPRAPRAGARQGDQLCVAGGVSLSPAGGDALQRMAAALRAREGAAVPLVLLRRGERVELQLTPRRWEGEGLLGARLRPLGRQ